MKPHPGEAIDTRHLRAFLAVCEGLSFRGAARQLNIAQPALSATIKQLEGIIGVKLFERNTRNVSITPAGIAFQRHARRALSALRDGHDASLQAAMGRSGRLTVGFSGAVSYALLPQIAWRYRAEFPLVSLQLRGERLTFAQVRALLDGTQDVGILRPPVNSADILLEIIKTEPLMCALHDDHPLTAQEVIELAALREWPYVSYPIIQNSTVQQATMQACHAVGFQPQVVQEVRETSTLISLVAAGVGVALVPQSVQALRIPGIEYRALSGEAPMVEMALAWRRGGRTPLVEGFIEVAQRVAASD